MLNFNVQVAICYIFKCFHFKIIQKTVFPFKLFIKIKIVLMDVRFRIDNK
jgi:hypothetical protein